MSTTPRTILRAHLGWDADEGDVRFLAEALGDEAALTAGVDLPDPPRVDVLVAGRPKPEQVAACDGLRVLLIPYAGLPPETRTLMRDHPEVAVHNIHHNATPAAEMALALLLAAAKRIVPSDRALRENRWAGRGRASEAVLLEGRSALLVGFGSIGRRLAPILRALRLSVTAVRSRLEATEIVDDTTVHPAGRLSDLLPDAQVVIVAAPLNDRTRGLLGRAELARLPADAVLVNVARGPIVDEDALYEALRDGAIGAAGLDVWYRYAGADGDPENTPPSNRPFGELDNVVLSPHRGGSVRETEALRMRHLADMLRAAARGESLANRVDLDLGY